MNKRGISAIVATVLIILITVASVTILWAAIIPMIQDNLDFSSLEGRVSVVTSKGYTYYDSGSSIASVQVKRDTDDGVMKRIKIAFSIDGNDFSSLVEAPGSGNTKVYFFDFSDGPGDPESVSVAPIFSVGNKEREGPLTSDVAIKKGTVSSGSLGFVYSLGESYTFNIEEGLVGYWRFEGNVEDSSGNGNNGVIVGDASLVNNGLRGQVASFDGSGDSIEVENFDYDVLKNGKEDSSWTLSVWAKPRGIQAGNENIIFGRVGCNGGIYIHGFGGGGFKFAIKTNNTGAVNTCWSGFKETTYVASPEESLTDWRHFVAVYNEREMFLYTNGDLSETEYFDSTIYGYSNSLFIGGLSDYTFDGLIDEAMIFNRALSAEEVKNLYDVQKG